MEIRKLVTVIEETLKEGGREVPRTVRKVAVAAVLENPFAGQFEEDLTQLIDDGEQLGALLSKRAVEALGGAAAESYGKAGIVGTSGELEHVAALLHPKFGTPVRDAVGGGNAIIPSAKKRGAALGRPCPGRDRDSPRGYGRRAAAPPDRGAAETGGQGGGRPSVTRSGRRREVTTWTTRSRRNGSPAS